MALELADRSNQPEEIRSSTIADHHRENYLERVKDLLKAKVPFTTKLLRRQFEVSMSEIGKLEGTVREAARQEAQTGTTRPNPPDKNQGGRYLSTGSGTYFSPTGNGD
jgi:hypothetical protein